MDRLPLILLTGFLGSGKTTLLRRILESPGMAGTAVLINEFGEIGLDHLLVRSVQGSAVVLQNGCICCTIRSDLQQGLRSLFDLRGEDRLPSFDRIAVETTGIADPAPIAHTLTVDPMLRHQIRLSNIVTTIDAVLGMGQLDRHGEALRQAAIADRLVITKSDIAGPEAVEALRKRLTELNPSGRLFDAHSRDFDLPGLLTEGIADPATKLAEVRHWLAAADGAARGNGTHDADDHDHGGAHAADIRTFSLRIEETVDWTAFGVWLTSLLHRHGSRVLRVKGLLNVPDALGPIVLHGVQHVIHPPTHLDAWPDEDTASRLVFVVQGLDPKVVKASLDRFLAAARDNRQQSQGETRMSALAKVRETYEVRARTGKGFEVKKGDLIRVTDLEGSQPVDFWAFNRKNPKEFLSPEHTKPSIEKLVPGVGDAAYTNQRRPIVRVVEDNSPGQHDMQYAACDKTRYRELGVKGYHASCQDNLHKALKKLGIDMDFTPQPWNLFTNFFINRDGTFTIKAPESKPGDSIVLRAEMDAYVVVSACPQDQNPTCGGNPTDIRVEVGR